MKQIEFWRWYIPDELTGKMHLSRWHMDEETAADYPGAVKEPATREVRPGVPRPAHSTPADCLPKL